MRSECGAARATRGWLRSALALVAGLALLAACGGKVPYIDSFSADPDTLTAGHSTELSAVFGGGDGIIEPGHIAVSSGVAVTVSPTTTTTYTLTVSDSGEEKSDSVTVVVTAALAWSFDAQSTDWSETATPGGGQAVATIGGGVLTLSATPGASGSTCPVARAELQVQDAAYQAGGHAAVTYLFSGVTTVNTDAATEALLTLVYGEQEASFDLPVGTGYTLRVEWGSSADQATLFVNDEQKAQVDKRAANGAAPGLILSVRSCPADGVAASFSASSLNIDAR